MKLLAPLAGAAWLALSGCVQTPAVDRLEPMPAATAEQSDLDLANNMVEPPPEAPPADRDSNLWERVREGFALDLALDNPRIRSQRDWYARHQAYLDRVATRAERYMHFIIAEAEARDIPTELALLPIVESAFDPFAYSHGRAAGAWQFIPGTGRHFGLDQNYWYDGRRDIVASTRAAFEYLEQLAERFDGDWLLALASYNAGAGNVNRAIRRNKARDLPTDFWNLQLPRETRAYVPKLLAIAQIVQDPESHGVALQPIADKPYFEIVDTGGQMDLAQAADMADISLEELYMLNPAFNRWATRPDGPHQLLLPVKRVDTFRTALAEQPEETRMAWQDYRIQSGDSLITIARRFHTTPEMLREANNLRGNTIVAGNTLLVPQAAQNPDNYDLSENARLAQSQNRAVANRRKSTVQVGPGDTLWDIARTHDVKVRELAKWNNMAPGDPLRIGQQLAVWSHNPSATPANADIPEMVRKVRYAVRRGDSLYRIADRFNVSINQIQSWNSIDRQNYLHPGQRLTLFVDIRNAY